MVGNKLLAYYIRAPTSYTIYKVYTESKVRRSTMGSMGSTEPAMTSEVHDE